MTDDAVMKQLIEWFGEPEELDDELADYAYHDDDIGVTIKHPLVFSLFHQPMLNHNVNERLRVKRQLCEEARAEGDWYSFIWLHERPYRAEALIEIGDDLSDADWWEAVGRVWADSENIRELAPLWEPILRSDRPHRECLMFVEEHEEFAELPDVIAVYQGCTVEHDDGWSWTTDVKKAVWFGDRFAQLEGGTARVRSGVVNKSDVLAYLTRRNESEILVDPELVTPTSDVR